MEAGFLTAMRHLDDIEAWSARAEDEISALSGRTPPSLCTALTEWPLVSAPMAETLTGASRAAVQRNLNWMEKRGLIREVTGVNQNGLTNANSQIFNQDTGSIAGGSEEGDRFAYALAACDFDDDGNDDLAVGVPGERLNDQDMAGAVNILYGTASDQAGNGGGLSDARNIMIHQDTPGIPGLVEPGDEFGRALACGDLNDDEYADLVIGIPNEDIGDLENSGLVAIIYGSENGLDLATYHDFDMGFLDEPGVVHAHARFGASLAIGDADLDGKSDLLISSVVFNAAGPPDSVMVLFQEPDLIRRQGFEPLFE
jgi:hypothetical protein